MGVLARGGGLEARQGWSWLQSVRGSVLVAGSTGTEPGRKFSRHRHGRSPTGPAPCLACPVLSPSPRLLFHCRSLCKAGFCHSPGSTVPELESGEGQSAWELKVEFSPHATVCFCMGLIHEVPQVGPTFPATGNGYRLQEWASEWEPEPGQGHPCLSVWLLAAAVAIGAGAGPPLSHVGSLVGR